MFKELYQIITGKVNEIKDLAVEMRRKGIDETDCLVAMNNMLSNEYDFNVILKGVSKAYHG